MNACCTVERAQSAPPHPITGQGPTEQASRGECKVLLHTSRCNSATTYILLSSAPQKTCAHFHFIPSWPFVAPKASNTNNLFNSDYNPS